MRQDQPKRRIALPVIVGSAVVVILAAAWAVKATGQDWFAGFLRDPLTIVAGTVLLVGLVLMLLLVGLLWRLGLAGRQRRKVASDAQAGSAAIEFVLVMPVLLWIMLIIVQSMLLVCGNLAVHHAAYLAARTAIVQVPERLTYDEPHNIVSPGGAKLEKIRQAAVCSLAAVSAGDAGAGGAGGGNTAAVEQGMRDFYAQSNKNTPGWIANMYKAKYDYANTYTKTTLIEPINGSVYGDRENLTVRVEHTFYMSVPYAKRVFAMLGVCKQIGNGDFGADMQAACTLTNEGLVDEIDVEQFPRAVGRGG